MSAPDPLAVYVLATPPPSTGDVAPRRRQDPDLLRRLLRAKDRMAAAPHEDWPVRKLAAVSGVSVAHFSRSFSDAFGVPPHRYLLTLRLERARALLRDTRAPILEVALASGWRSLGTFGRTFHDALGESPSAYRAQERSPGAQDRSPGALHPVPLCVVRASSRPGLRMAVSEKRRHERGE